MKHGSLFSGIGGFDLAAEWMGWDNVFHCEWAEFPRKILSYYWPQAESYHDITRTDFSKHAGQIDILTGGFPCQPYSAAGKRKGKDDDRHLWPQMLRAVREIRPRWVVGENVFGLITWNRGMVFEEVCADLEAEGYAVQPFVLPAAAVNAPHRRDRVWFVAHADGSGDRGYGWEAGHEGWGASKNWPESLRQEHGQTCSSRIDATGSNGDVAYANDTRTDKYLRSQRKRETKNGDEQFKEFKHRQNGGDRIAADAKNYDNQEQDRANNTNGQNERRRNSQVWTELARYGGNRDAADATEPGLQRSNGCKQTVRELTRHGKPCNWQDFPTEPPICGGDDGLPAELDGITFPKWRNESIKGYGNAIVPQVALQIFQAIEQYENTAE